MKPGTVAVGYLDNEEWSASFGLCLRDLLLVDGTKGKQRIVPNGVELRRVTATGGLPAGRNEVARLFLDSECEWLFVVDTDMGFGPTTVDDLIASAEEVDGGVVAGLCFSLRCEGHGEFYSVITDQFPTIYDWAETDETVGFAARVDYERDTLLHCDATGSACILIHRMVLERMREQFGDHWYDPIQHPKAPNGVFSEDLSFCMRLAALEIPLWVNTAVKTSHHKGQGRYLTETTFDRQLRAVRAEADEFFAAWAALTWRADRQKPMTLESIAPLLKDRKPARV